MNQLDIIMDMISNSNFGVNTTQMFQNGGIYGRYGDVVGDVAIKSFELPLMYTLFPEPLTWESCSMTCMSDIKYTTTSISFARGYS